MTRLRNILQRVNDFLLGVNTNRAQIARRLKVIWLAILQLGGGVILYSADTTRGTPLIITQHGISMPAFALTMMLFGIVLLYLGLRHLQSINSLRVLFWTLPFIAYFMFTAYGVAIGQQSGQGAFIYGILYLGAMTDVWGTD